MVLRSMRSGFRTLFGFDRGVVVPMLGFPLRVNLSFALMVVLIGLRETDWRAMVVWLAVATISVVAHELGHAFVAARWGVVLRIELHALGGATQWTSVAPVSWRQRMVIIIAGPAAGLLVALVAFWLGPLSGEGLVGMIASHLLWSNVAWTVFNLLPIVPLDGGQLLKEVLVRLTGRGEWLVALVGLVTSILALVVSVGLGLVWSIVLLGWYAFLNLEVLIAHYEARRRTEWSALSARDHTRERY
jgi:Zn-dependent protease